MTIADKEKLVATYRHMANRLHEILTQGTEKTGQRLRHALVKVEDEAVALKELTKLEASQVGDWIKRDLHSIAKSLSRTGDEVKEWLPLEVEAEEKFLVDKLLSVADQTTVELLELKENADLSSFEIWHTGEVTAPGILQCTQCGEKIHLRATGHIPPCPKCRNTEFARIADDIPH